VRKEGLKSGEEWWEEWSRDGPPFQHTLLSRQDVRGHLMADWLGYEKHDKSLPFEEARELVRKEGLTNVATPRRTWHASTATDERQAGQPQP